MAAEPAARWLVLGVRSPAAELETELAAGLLDLGGSAVEDAGDGLLRTWLPEPPSVDGWVERATALLVERAGCAVEVTWSWEEDRDWLAEWRRGLGARRIGERFVVTPTWVQPEARDGDIVIAIDPQMAFGTGEHATTRIVVRALEGLIRPDDRVLDMGTGSGILAIAAAALGARSVDAVESDADALPNALENLNRNSEAGAVRLLHASVDGDWLEQNGRYDVILANVLSGVLRPLLPAFRAALDPGGRLVLCGILCEESADMRRAAAEAGLRLVSELEEEEWWCGVFCHPA